MFNIGWPELVLILVVILLLFGADRLPEVARKLGEAVRELKKSLKGNGDDHPAG
jgi:sec-independent protein translocase protein TatA